MSNKAKREEALEKYVKQSRLKQISRWNIFKRRFRAVFKVVFTITFICSFVFGVAFGLFWWKFGEQYQDYSAFAKKVVSESNANTFRAKETSYIYDNKGKLITRLREDRDVIYLSYDKIPKKIKDAFLSVEDRRFYEHKGVDFKSLAKAVYLLVKDHDAKRGASTITQQLARGTFLNYEKSYERKAKEMLIALELEKKYTKDQILEYYINNVYFGNGYYGIGAASRGYFSKEAKDLTLSEAAFLCAIPNNPTWYDPLKYQKHTLARRDKIISDMCMLHNEYKNSEKSALNEKIKLKRPKSSYHNYDCSYAIDCSVKYLMKESGFKFKYSFNTMKDYEKYKESYGDTYEEAKKDLYTGGYKIYTTLDKDKQTQLQKVVNRTLDFNKSKDDNGYYLLQGASTVIDNSTQKVVAVVGGRSQKIMEENGIATLNRAYQTPKQPGSTIKPILVYTPSLERNYTPNTIVEDSPFEGGPHNSGGSYSGSIPLRSAVEQSRNVVAWKLFQELGPKTGLKYLQNMKFQTIVPSDYYPAASLGGLTYGVTPVEMASAYATLANEGTYKEPTCLDYIVDKRGYKHFVTVTPTKIYKKAAAQNMTDILEGVPVRGTGVGLGLSSGMPCAMKTGTTDNQTNGWLCGYTPYYTVSVWVGMDSTQSISNLWGASYPGTIWHDIQEYLNKGKKIKSFSKSALGNSKKDKEEQSKLNDLFICKKIDQLLQDYLALEFNTDKDINKENSLYNSIAEYINQIQDNSLHNKYVEQLNAAEMDRKAAIQNYKAKKAKTDKKEKTTKEIKETEESPTTDESQVTTEEIKNTEKAPTTEEKITEKEVTTEKER